MLVARGSEPKLTTRANPARYDDVDVESALSTGRRRLTSLTARFCGPPPTNVNETGTGCGGRSSENAPSVTTTTWPPPPACGEASPAAIRTAVARSPAAGSGWTPSSAADRLDGEPFSTTTRGTAPAVTSHTRVSGAAPFTRSMTC